MECEWQLTMFSRPEKTCSFPKGVSDMYDDTKKLNAISGPLEEWATGLSELCELSLGVCESTNCPKTKLQSIFTFCSRFTRSTDATVHVLVFRQKATISIFGQAFLFFAAVFLHFRFPDVARLSQPWCPARFGSRPAPDADPPTSRPGSDHDGGVGGARRDGRKKTQENAPAPAIQLCAGGL